MDFNKDFKNGQKITIAELSKKEVEKILKTKKFNRLAPVSCHACGYKGFFKRRIFKIDGDYDVGDDEGQNVVRNHMKQKHDLEYIHFKFHRCKRRSRRIPNPTE